MYIHIFKIILATKKAQKVSVRFNTLVTYKAEVWLTIVNIDAATAAEKYINPTSPTFAKK